MTWHGPHLEDNLAALDITLKAEHPRTLREVSAPTLNYPAPMHGAQRAMLQFAGTAVDGEDSAVYPPLLRSDARYQAFVLIAERLPRSR